MTLRFSSMRPLVLTLSCLLMPSSWAADSTKEHQATEQHVRKGIDSFIGRQVVDSVRPVPGLGLYEVVLKSGELIYTDARTTFVLDGQVIDTKTRKNLTSARMSELSKINFADLPLNQAIKQVRGTGKRVYASFEDPNCGYCKQFTREAQNLKDVTIYTFLLPILSPDSTEKAKAIWCSKDPAAAWNDWMINGKAPASASCDTSAIDRNLRFAQANRISGTPTIFLKDGTRIPGAIRAAQLDKELDR